MIWFNYSDVRCASRMGFGQLAGPINNWMQLAALGQMLREHWISNRYIRFTSRSLSSWFSGQRHHSFVYYTVIVDIGRWSVVIESVFKLRYSVPKFWICQMRFIVDAQHFYIMSRFSQVQIEWWIGAVDGVSSNQSRDGFFEAKNIRITTGLF